MDVYPHHPRLVALAWPGCQTALATLPGAALGRTAGFGDSSLLLRSKACNTRDTIREDVSPNSTGVRSVWPLLAEAEEENGYAERVIRTIRKKKWPARRIPRSAVENFISDDS